MRLLDLKRAGQFSSEMVHQLILQDQLNLASQTVSLSVESSNAPLVNSSPKQIQSDSHLTRDSSDHEQVFPYIQSITIGIAGVQVSVISKNSKEIGFLSIEGINGFFQKMLNQDIRFEFSVGLRSRIDRSSVGCRWTTVFMERNIRWCSVLRFILRTTRAANPPKSP